MRDQSVRTPASICILSLGDDALTASQLASQTSPSGFSTHPSPRWVKTALEVAFKEGAGVLEVLFGVGFGGGDALKRFVEDADDPPLFGERGDAESMSELAKLGRVECRACCATDEPSLIDLQ